MRTVPWIVDPWPLPASTRVPPCVVEEIGYSSRYGEWLDRRHQTSWPDVRLVPNAASKTPIVVANPRVPIFEILAATVTHLARSLVVAVVAAAGVV